MPKFISIPNVLGNFFGGQPYNIDLSINFDGPSTLKVSVFNETGNYQTPNPNYGTTQTISVGDFKFVGVLAQYTLRTEAASQILELEYDDCSFLLDNIYIGLHKRHGINPDANQAGVGTEYFIDTSGSNNNIIIVGKEILKQGQDFGGYSNVHIHDVGYHFNELLKKINVKSLSLPNVNYVRDYSGTLREVLSSWCSDYGLMFYWDFTASNIQNGLKFFDLKNIVNINNSISDCDITNKTLRVSARGTIGVGEVAYYEREGGPLNIGYTVPPKLLTTRCLTMEDLYGTGPEVTALQIGTCLAYYSQSLRDLYYWYNYRKISGPERLIELNESELAEFGFSNVVLACSSNYNLSAFNTISAFGPTEDTVGDKANKFSAIHGFSYYFFIAKYNEEEYKAKTQGEDRLANEFLGKHWFRSFDVAGKDPQASAEGPGMNPCEYIDHSAALPSLPFANFGHTNSSYVGGLVQEGKSGSVSLTRSLVYGHREGMWYPNRNDTDTYQGLLDYYDSLSFRFVDSSYDRLFSDLGLSTSIINQSKGYGLWIAYIRGPLPVTISSTNNFLDQNQMSPCYSGDANSTILGYYGLKSNKCYYITFDGFKLMAPCGALSFGENPSLGGSFVVKVGDTKSGELNTTVNKIQYTNRNVPAMKGVAKCNIQFNPVSGDDISQIRPIGNATSEQQSQNNRNISVNDVKDYVKNVLNKNSFVQANNSKYIEFTLAGLPTKIANVKDGLDSLSIGVSEDGVFTQYAFSDKLIKAQEALEVRKLRNIVTNYNNLPKRYLALLEGKANEVPGFIQET